MKIKPSAKFTKHSFILECDLPETVSREDVHKYLNDVIDMGLGVITSDPDHELYDFEKWTTIVLKK